MLTPVGYLWVFTILLVLGDGCCCCVPCLELALLVTAFSHRLQWRTSVPRWVAIPCQNVCEIQEIKHTFGYCILSPFPLDLVVFLTVLDKIFLQYHCLSCYDVEAFWSCSDNLFLTSLELLNQLLNSLEITKCTRGPNAFSPSSSGFLTLCFLCRDRFFSALLRTALCYP